MWCQLAQQAVRQWQRLMRVPAQRSLSHRHSLLCPGKIAAGVALHLQKELCQTSIWLLLLLLPRLEPAAPPLAAADCCHTVATVLPACS